MEYTVAANDGIEHIIGIWQILCVPLATIDRRSVPTGGGDHGFREVDSAYLGPALRSSQGKDTVSRADIEHVTSANDASCIECDIGRLRGQRTKDSFVTLRTPRSIRFAQSLGKRLAGSTPELAYPTPISASLSRLERAAAVEDITRERSRSAEPSFLRAAGAVDVFGCTGPPQTKRIRSETLPEPLKGHLQPRSAVDSFLREFC
jgi:hypothetical protein